MEKKYLFVNVGEDVNIMLRMKYYMSIVNMMNLKNTLKRIEHVIRMNDKLMHFIVGTIIGVNVKRLGWLTIVISIVVAISKEILDHYFGNGISFWDMGATVLGTIIGVFLIAVVSE